LATNQKIKKALLDKLGVTPQRLSQLVQKRKAELPMSTEHAVYTLAFENGVDVSKALGKEDTAEVRALVAQLRSSKPTATPALTNGGPARRTSPAKRDVKITIAGVDIGTIPALSPTHAKEAKLMAERVYPTLYFFENSVRDLIERVLSVGCGPTWWTTAVPGTVQQTATKHKTDEQKDPWHSQRSKREIDYVFLNELWAIIKYQWSHFKDLFPDQAWVQTIITRDMNVSRRVLAHMSPLADDDVRNIELKFRHWVKQLKAVEHLLP
jgi:hypothetical protein